jgi:hypothetical protein
MTLSSDLVPAGEALAGMGALLDRLDPDRSRVDPKTRLAWLRAARSVQARVTALTAQLTGEADQARAAEETTGTPLASWLGMGENLSRKEAAGTLRQARRLAQHRLVGEAAVAGRLGTSQARAITTVLDNLAPQLDDAQQARAEQVMVGLAGHRTPTNCPGPPARSSTWSCPSVPRSPWRSTCSARPNRRTGNGRSGSSSKEPRSGSTAPCPAPPPKPGSPSWTTMPNKPAAPRSSGGTRWPTR